MLGSVSIFECLKGKRVGTTTSLGLLGGARLQNQLECQLDGGCEMVGWSVRSLVA